MKRLSHDEINFHEPLPFPLLLSILGIDLPISLALAPFVTSHEFQSPVSDLVSDTTEDPQNLFFRSLRPVRIVERPVNHLLRTGNDWAGLTGRIADRDNLVKRLIHKRIDRLRLVPADVYPAFRHDPNRQGMHALRLRPRATDLDVRSADMSQPPFRHLRTAAIAGAYDKNMSYFSHVFDALRFPPSLETCGRPAGSARRQ